MLLYQWQKIHLEYSMKSFTRALLIGLSILLPVVLSIQLVIWLARSIEGWLRPVWLLLVPEQYYFPGMALIGFVIVAALIGYSIRQRFIRMLVQLPGKLMEKIPVVNYVYSTIKDFLDLMAGKSFSDQAVVWVKLPDSDARLMGIVTKRGDAEDSKLAGMMKEDEVAVYLPMSYQAGGYMLILPASQVEKADVSPGEALHLIMSAGLGQKKGLPKAS
jgi:uncharacterized membrane protein